MADNQSDSNASAPKGNEDGKTQEQPNISPMSSMPTKTATPVTTPEDAPPKTDSSEPSGQQQPVPSPKEEEPTPPEPAEKAPPAVLVKSDGASNISSERKDTAPDVPTAATSTAPEEFDKNTKKEDAPSLDKKSKTMESKAENNVTETKDDPSKPTSIIAPSSALPNDFEQKQATAPGVLQIITSKAAETAGPDAPPAQKGLAAHMSTGKDVNVRIRLQNVLVGAPSDTELDDGMDVDQAENNGSGKFLLFSNSGSNTGMMNEKERAPEDFERSASESTNTSIDVDNEHGMSYTVGITVKNETESNSSQGGSEDEDHANHQHHQPRRGRSSSFDIREGESGLSSRETSTSSSQPGVTASGAAAGDGFAEASLLLGIAESGPMVKETDAPATIPTAMTSFLDNLNDEQRRVRHRHIPAVEGFRKLCKREIKQDLAMARVSSKKKGKGSEHEHPLESTKGDFMDVDDEASASENDLLSDLSAAKDRKAGDAFVVPSDSSIAFANSGRLASLMESLPFENNLSEKSLRSPQLVESLTAFNPPRPQESIGTKTKNRLKRWESHPKEVEVDLMNYRKTVQRTRMELHKAEDEHNCIEAVTSMVRTHFANHLVAFREELAVVNRQLQGTQSSCLKAAELYVTKTVTTRAGAGKSMKDVLSTLKSLGEEMEAQDISKPGSLPLGIAEKDWKFLGVGGVSSVLLKEDAAENTKGSLANGWILEGDKVITPSGEGEVVNVSGPCLLGSAETTTQTPKPKLEKTGITKVTKSSPNKDMNSMDIDPKETGPPENQGKTAKKIVLPERIGVRLSDGVKYFNPSEIRLKDGSFCYKDRDLANRWQQMTETALKMGICHDYMGMDSYIHSTLLKKINEEKNREKESINTDDLDAKGKTNSESNNGSASPKSVTQHDNVRTLLPFGAGLMSAPQQIKDFPSIIPVNTLEELVRKTVYEGDYHDAKAGTPKMPLDVKGFETQREELNKVKVEVMQLRNRLSRQKRLCGLNERSLIAGKNCSHKVEGLLLEMQMDLKNLKERLQDELRELGIGNYGSSSALDINEPKSNGDGNQNVFMSNDNENLHESKSDEIGSHDESKSNDNLSIINEQETNDDSKINTEENQANSKNGIHENKDASEISVNKIRDDPTTKESESKEASPKDESNELNTDILHQPEAEPSAEAAPNSASTMLSVSNENSFNDAALPSATTDAAHLPPTTDVAPPSATPVVNSNDAPICASKDVSATDTLASDGNTDKRNAEAEEEERESKRPRL